MKILITSLVTTILAVIAAIAIAYSGIYDVSAAAPHNRVTAWLLSTAAHASIERRAGDIEVPDLSDESLVRSGASDFNAMCAGCHGAPGVPQEAMGRGLNPPPPDLAESAGQMSPAELFWVTRNGIRMSGMPAWSATHDDEALWPVVAFMVRLPDLDAAAYQALLASAEGMGHHGRRSEPAHSHQVPDDTENTADHVHDPVPEETAEDAHDDGHDHEH